MHALFRTNLLHFVRNAECSGSGTNSIHAAVSRAFATLPCWFTCLGPSSHVISIIHTPANTPMTPVSVSNIQHSRRRVGLLLSSSISRPYNFQRKDPLFFHLKYEIAEIVKILDII